MPVSPQPTFNDDLLLADVDRKEVARSFPTFMHVLDFPELREVFDGYDVSANRWKKNLRRAGLATIALGVIALLGASTEPLYDKLPPLFSNAIVVVSALAGLLSIVISTFGVLHSASKNRWLEARLMTERLRQFQFQTLVFRIPTILRCAASPDFDAQFGKARERWFSTFKMEHVDHLPAKLKEVLDDDSEEQFQLHDSDALDGVPASDPLLTELFAAYRLLRIRHQILYANFKLGGDSLNFPRKQVSLLSGVSLICILLVFFAHFAVSISSVSQIAAVRDHRGRAGLHARDVGSRPDHLDRHRCAGGAHVRRGPAADARGRTLHGVPRAARTFALSFRRGIERARARAHHDRGRAAGLSGNAGVPQNQLRGPVRSLTAEPLFVFPYQRRKSAFSSITWMPLAPLTTWVTRRSAARLHSV